MKSGPDGTSDCREESLQDFTETIYSLEPQRSDVILLLNGTNLLRQQLLEKSLASYTLSSNGSGNDLVEVRNHLRTRFGAPHLRNRQDIYLQFVELVDGSDHTIIPKVMASIQDIIIQKIIQASPHLYKARD